MMTRNNKEKSYETRHQFEYTVLDDLVPQDHLLRLVDQHIDFSFIYDLVEDKYSQENGRPSIDPITLIKIPMIQYFFGIPSMRQTIKEIEVNVAYRWFLGIGLTEPVPHFSTFGKNYKRRFEGTSLAEQIFSHILSLCISQGLVNSESIFFDGTHVKACANGRKTINEVVEVEAKWLADELESAINEDRVSHGKKILKPSHKIETKNQKSSPNDPDCGWFHKGDHKQVFAYNIQTACDSNGWILGYDVSKGNTHDTQAFPGLYEKIKDFKIKYMIGDAGYKTPTIANFLLNTEKITPVFPYTRPRRKPENRDIIYDEYYDCFIDEENRIYHYSTTNRKGYREYKMNPCDLNHHSRVITRHVWQDSLEECEHIRHTKGMKELYQTRKESIERIFGTAKEHHGFRYTHLIGKELMEFKVGLTFSCLNMKKLVKYLTRKSLGFFIFESFLVNIRQRPLSF